MIQRDGSGTIVPTGDTRLQKDDKVIMIKAEHALEFPKPDAEEKLGEEGN